MYDPLFTTAMFTVVECPALDPPENGALINDTIRNSPIVIMLCHEDFDIPALKNNFNGLLRCLDTEKWFPYETVPDCTGRYSILLIDVISCYFPVPLGFLSDSDELRLCCYCPMFCDI